ncbi:LOW QUALITY PROTEIN: olfactory receptor 10AD1 [Molossus nigricans]
MVDLRNGITVTEFILVGQSSLSTQALLFALFRVLYSLAMAMNDLIIFTTWTDPRLNPMVFLGHLSFLDICFITPQMLIHLVVKNYTLFFASCLTQMNLVLGVRVAECTLLAFMTNDFYVAICHPLSYAQITSQQVCVKAGNAWFFGLINGILDYMTFYGPFCGDNHIKSSCGDPPTPTLFSLRVIFANAIMVLLSPMVLIVISYALILASILSRASSSGQRKPSFTCTSHLTVVIIFYTVAMLPYVNSCSKHGLDKGKPFSLLYTIITLMGNPIIYNF